MCSLRSFVVLLLTLVSLVSFAQDVVEPGTPEATAKAKREAALKAMREVAKLVQITQDGESIERVPNPVYHYEDPTRSLNDGAVWVWGKKGRPEALVTITRDNPKNWIAEIASFPETPIEVQSGRVEGVVEFIDLTSATAPTAGSARLLKSQLKLIARQFKAYQMWDDHGRKKDQRYQLRMSTPVYEYEDKDRHVQAGAIFLFCVGSNPEMALMLEAADDKWRCVFGRMGWASANVTFQGKEFYRMPRIRGLPADRYSMRIFPNPAAK